MIQYKEINKGDMILKYYMMILPVKNLIKR